MTMPEQARSLGVKTALVSAVVVASNVAGNLLLASGMKLADSPAAPLDYIRVLFHPLVAGGVLLLILWMLSHMVLLSWADLSYVLPVTSIGYALAALAGKLFLAEQISPARWAGIALIVTGVTVVGRTPPVTHPEKAP